MNWCLLGVSHHLGPVWAVFARCPGLVLHHVLRFDCIVVGNLSHAPVISPIIGFCSLFCRISSKFRLTDCLFFQGIIQRILTLKLLCLKGYTKQNAIKGQFCLPEATFLRHSSLPPVSSSFHLPQHSHFSSKKEPVYRTPVYFHLMDIPLKFETKEVSNESWLCTVPSLKSAW